MELLRLVQAEDCVVETRERTVEAQEGLGLDVHGFIYHPVFCRYFLVSRIYIHLLLFHYVLFHYLEKS